MKVQELIQYLKQCDPTDDVKIRYWEAHDPQDSGKSKETDAVGAVKKAGCVVIH